MRLYDVSADGKLTLHLHDAQRRCWDSSARFTYFVAGTQSGKTSFGPWWLWKQITAFGSGDYLAVSSTFPLFKKKMLPEIRTVFEHVLRLGRYWSSDQVLELRDPSTGQFWAERADDPMWGRVILASAQQGGSLESATAKAAWEDECGQDEFPLSAHEAIVRRLSLSQGPILGTTTPYNLGWLKTEVMDRALAGDTDYQVVNADSTVNPAFPQAEFERAKRTYDSWKFDMMYRGLLARPPTLIYGAYLDELRGEGVKGGHLVAPFPVPPEWPRYVGVDFGTVGTAVTWLAHDVEADVFYAYRCTLEGGKTTAEYAGDALNHARGIYVAGWAGGAPSEKQLRWDWDAAGVPLAAPPISDIEMGIDRIVALFKTRRLFVFSDQTGLRSELGTYQRKADEQGQPLAEIKAKATFHRLDSLRYAGSLATMPDEEDWTVYD